MATINNTIPATRDTSSGIGYILGVILLVALILALFYYGMPFLRNQGSTAPSYSSPGKVDVNVNPNGNR